MKKPKKKINLILYNVPELESQDLKQRVEDDLDICEDIIDDELQIDNFSIFEIFRLGKKEDNKMTPTNQSNRYQVRKIWQIFQNPMQTEVLTCKISGHPCEVE